MSEQQVFDVTPSDSVSATGNKKKQSRPGKAQRNSGRSNTPSQASANTAPTSLSGAAMFARKMSFTPTPQPGKFPVVFPSGAGEPTRDEFMSIDGCALDKCFTDIGLNYINSARYAEFSANSSYTDAAFKKDVATSSILALTQQIVHAHANMGLPLGDFSSVSSTEHYIMSSIRSIVQQFGEFSVESLGTRYLFYDYEAEVKALVRTAFKISSNDPAQIRAWLKMHWLPAVENDKRTKFIVANRLAGYFQQFGINISIEELCSHLFNDQGRVYPVLKNLLPEGNRDRFDVLFEPYTTRADFASKFKDDDGEWLLNALNLYWPNAKEGHLLWTTVPKTVFPELADPWAKKRATLTKFFSCRSGFEVKSSTSGTAAQLAEVSTRDGITVVKSRVALSAPEYSLLACFPSTNVFEHSKLNVVLTTSISTKVRATEFTQLDWLG